MIRRAVHRRGLAVIALLASLAAAVWVLQPPQVELGPGSVSGRSALTWERGAERELTASIENRGDGSVTIQRVLPGDPDFDGLVRITGSDLRPTRLEPGEEVDLTLRTRFTSCRHFTPDTSSTLVQFRVAVDHGDPTWVSLGRPVRVAAPKTCPER